MAPIKVSLSDITEEMIQAEQKAERTVSYYIGVVPQEQKINVEVFQPSDLINYAIIVATLVLSLILSTYCVFQTSHAVIKPLRILNTRMNEILQANNYNDV